MKKRLLTLILFFTGVTVYAQDIKKNFSFGASVHGTMAYALNASSSSDMMGPDFKQTYQRYTDSMDAFITYRFTFGASVWAFYQLNKNWQLQAGVSYVDLGFQREQKNIQFGDKLYPGIGDGILMDLSAGSGDKSIAYNYRYHYLQVPVMVNYKLFQSHDFKYNYYMAAGASMNFLLNHHMTANLDQFSVDGENVFQLDSTGYEGDGFGVNLLFSLRGEYKLENDLNFFLQPVFGYSPMSVSNSPITSNPLYLQLNAGVIYFLSE